MNTKFVQEDGRETYISSTIPGVTIVPDGLSLEDAEALSDEDFAQQIIKHQKQHPVKTDKLTQAVEDLHTKVEQLLKDKK